jgi:hypothetical protein
MEKQIWVRALYDFEVHRLGGAEIDGKINEGQVYLAELNEESKEYFAKDDLGREVYVGELDALGQLNLDAHFEIVQTIKISELRPGSFIAYGSEVITQEEAIKRYQQCDETPMFTISQDFILSVLQQAYEDSANGIDREEYAAPNKGLLIVFDI